MAVVAAAGLAFFGISLYSSTAALEIDDLAASPSPWSRKTIRGVGLAPHLGDQGLAAEDRGRRSGP